MENKEKVVFDTKGNYRIESANPNEHETSVEIDPKDSLDKMLEQPSEPKKVIQKKTVTKKTVTKEPDVNKMESDDTTQVIAMDKFLQKFNIMQEQLETLIYRNLVDIVCSPATAFELSNNIIIYGLVKIQDKVYLVHLQDSSKKLHTVIKVITTGNTAKCENVKAKCSKDGIIAAEGKLLCSVLVTTFTLPLKYQI